MWWRRKLRVAICSEGTPLSRKAALPGLKFPLDVGNVGTVGNQTFSLDDTSNNEGKVSDSMISPDTLESKVRQEPSDSIMMVPQSAGMSWQTKPCAEIDFSRVRRFKPPFLLNGLSNDAHLYP